MVKNNKGITLVEIIIVVAILGIIMTTVSSLFSFGIKSFKITSDKGFTQQNERLIVTKITNKLRTAKKIKNVVSEDCKEVLSKEILKEEGVQVDSITFTGDKKNLTIKLIMKDNPNEKNFDIRIENENDMKFIDSKQIYYSHY